MVAIAAALPIAASVVGSMLPAIVDLFRSGKSPEEAAQIVAPKRQEIVDRLIGTGMNQAAAEAMADESIKGELAQAQLPEPMNPWLTGVLMLGGGIAGAKLGSMAKARLSPSAGAPATPKTNPADAAPPAAAPTGPSSAEVAMAQAGGMPLTRGKAVVTKGGGDVGAMMAGPFPAERAEMPLSLGKTVVPKRAQNVDVGAMLGGGPFPG